MGVKSFYRSIDLVNNKLISNNLINQKDQVLLSFSGGQDSICLLFMLNQLYNQLELNITFFWCHHLWQTDSFYLMQQVAKLSFLFQFNSCFAIPSNFISSELLARKWRQSCSYRVSLFYNYSKVCLAHNSNDKVETILFNFMRGTGLTGLSSLCWTQFFSKHNITKEKHISQHQYLKYLSSATNSCGLLRTKGKPRAASCAEQIEDELAVRALWGKGVNNYLLHRSEMNVRQDKRSVGGAYTAARGCSYYSTPQLATDSAEVAKRRNKTRKAELRTEEFREVSTAGQVSIQIPLRALTTVKRRSKKRLAKLSFATPAFTSPRAKLTFIGQLCKARPISQRAPTGSSSSICSANSYGLLCTKEAEGYTPCKAEESKAEGPEGAVAIFFQGVPTYSETSYEPVGGVEPATQRKPLLVPKGGKQLLTPFLRTRSKGFFETHDCFASEGKKASPTPFWGKGLLPQAHFRFALLTPTDCFAQKKQQLKNPLPLQHVGLAKLAKQYPSNAALACKAAGIIRPLLSISRFEINKICYFWQLPIYPDTSNQKVQFLRNRVRRQLLPTLKFFFNPKIENIFLQLAEIVEIEDYCLTQIVNEFTKNTDVYDAKLETHSLLTLFYKKEKKNIIRSIRSKSSSISEVHTIINIVNRNKDIDELLTQLIEITKFRKFTLLPLRASRGVSLSYVFYPVQSSGLLLPLQGLRGCRSGRFTRRSIPYIHQPVTDCDSLCYAPPLLSLSSKKLVGVAKRSPYQLRKPFGVRGKISKPELLTPAYEVELRLYMESPTLRYSYGLFCISSKGVKNKEGTRSFFCAKQSWVSLKPLLRVRRKGVSTTTPAFISQLCKARTLLCFHTSLPKNCFAQEVKLNRRLEASPASNIEDVKALRVCQPVTNSYKLLLSYASPPTLRYITKGKPLYQLRKASPEGLAKVRGGEVQPVTNSYKLLRVRRKKGKPPLISHGKKLIDKIAFKKNELRNSKLSSEAAAFCIKQPVGELAVGALFASHGKELAFDLSNLYISKLKKKSVFCFLPCMQKNKKIKTLYFAKEIISENLKLISFCQFPYASSNVTANVFKINLKSLPLCFLEIYLQVNETLMKSINCERTRRAFTSSMLEAGGATTSSFHSASCSETSPASYARQAPSCAQRGSTVTNSYGLLLSYASPPTLRYITKGKFLLTLRLKGGKQLRKASPFFALHVQQSLGDPLYIYPQPATNSYGLLGVRRKKGKPRRASTSLICSAQESIPPLALQGKTSHCEKRYSFATPTDCFAQEAGWKSEVLLRTQLIDNKDVTLFYLSAFYYLLPLLKHYYAKDIAFLSFGSIFSSVLRISQCESYSEATAPGYIAQRGRGKKQIEDELASFVLGALLTLTPIHLLTPKGFEETYYCLAQKVSPSFAPTLHYVKRLAKLTKETFHCGKGVKKGTDISFSHPNNSNINQNIWLYFLQNTNTEIKDLYFFKFFIYFFKFTLNKWQIYWPNRILCLPLAFQQRIVKLFLLKQNRKNIQYSKIKIILAMS